MSDGLEFKTTDRYLAAYLLAQKHLYLRCQPSDHRKVEFIFAHDALLDGSRQDFLNNAGGIQDFCRGLDTVNTIIREAKDTERRTP